MAVGNKADGVPNKFFTVPKLHFKALLFRCRENLAAFQLQRVCLLSQYLWMSQTQVLETVKTEIDIGSVPVGLKLQHIVFGQKAYQFPEQLASVIQYDHAIFIDGRADARQGGVLRRQRPFEMLSHAFSFLITVNTGTGLATRTGQLSLLVIMIVTNEAMASGEIYRPDCEGYMRLRNQPSPALMTKKERVWSTLSDHAWRVIHPSMGTSSNTSPS